MPQNHNRTKRQEGEERDTPGEIVTHPEPHEGATTLGGPPTQLVLPRHREASVDRRRAGRVAHQESRLQVARKGLIGWLPALAAVVAPVHAPGSGDQDDGTGDGEAARRRIPLGQRPPTGLPLPTPVGTVEELTSGHCPHVPRVG